MELTNKEKQILISIARNSIKSLFEDGIVYKDIKLTDYPILESKSGAFVTLTIEKRLRGCIGYIVSDKPLMKTVEEAAIQAAMHDPRFPSLTAEEFDNVDLEISILSEPFPMNSYDEIVVGKHGLILTEGGRRGLLLPQVPIEHNLNKEEYLDALCQKAGLFSGYWKEKQLNLEAFTAEVFSEKNLED